jgi:hypothetical protein
VKLQGEEEEEEEEEEGLVVSVTPGNKKKKVCVQKYYNWDLAYYSLRTY